MEKKKLFYIKTNINCFPLNIFFSFCHNMYVFISLYKSKTSSYVWIMRYCLSRKRWISKVIHCKTSSKNHMSFMNWRIRKADIAEITITQKIIMNWTVSWAYFHKFLDFDQPSLFECGIIFKESLFSYTY